MIPDRWSTIERAHIGHTLFSGEHIATGVPYVHRKTLLPVSVNGDITRLSGCLLMV